MNSAAPRTFNAASGDILVTSVFLDAPSPATLVKTGNFTLTLSNQSSTAANVWGTTTISQGTLAIARVGAQTNLPGWDTSGRYSVASGATLAVSNSVNATDIGTMLGTTNFAPGSNIGFDTGLGTGAGDRTYSANITNTGQGALGVRKSGTGTLTLSGTNTYTGPTTIQAGTLQLGSALTTSGRLIMSGSSSLDLNGNNATFTYSAGGCVGASTNTITDNAVGTGTSWVTLNDTNGWAQGPMATLITDGANGRKVGLSIKNNSMWDSPVSNANNTYSGGTLVSGGPGSGSRLSFGIATGNYTPTLSNGTLTKSEIGTGAVTLGTGATDKGQIQFDNSGSVNSTFYNDIVYNTTLGADIAGGVRLVKNNMVLAGTQTANLADVSLVSNGATTGSIAGKITGSQGLRLMDNGSNGLTITLSNTSSTNDYAGDTQILRALSASDISVLKLGAADQIPDGAGKGNVNVAGKFQLNGFNEAINGLNNTGAATFSVVENSHASTNSILTLGGGDANGSYNGTIRNGAAAALAITKTGTGTQTLAGTNTYTGATTINSGTLLLDTAGSIASTALGFGVTDISNGLLTANNALFSFSGTLSLAINAVSVSDNTWILFNGTGFDDTALSISGVTSDIGSLTFSHIGSGNWQGTDGFNRTWTFSSDLGTLNVIPEPATWALLAGGLGVVALLRRRRNS